MPAMTQRKSRKKNAATLSAAAAKAAEVRRRSEPKTVAGLPRGKTAVLGRDDREVVVAYIAAVRAGEKSDDAVVEVTNSAGSTFAHTYGYRRETSERYDSESPSFVGDLGGVDGWLAKLIEQAGWPGAPAQALRCASQRAWCSSVSRQFARRFRLAARSRRSVSASLASDSTR
jgi:hypothetical protein